MKVKASGYHFTQRVNEFTSEDGKFVAKVSNAFQKPAGLYTVSAEYFEDGRTRHIDEDKTQSLTQALSLFGMNILEAKSWIERQEAKNVH